MLNQDQSFIFNTYDSETFTHSEWLRDVNKHYNLHQEIKNAEFLEQSTIQILINDNYSFRIKVINNNHYFYKGTYLIDLTLKYINKPMTFYIDQSLLNIVVQNEYV